MHNNMIICQPPVGTLLLGWFFWWDTSHVHPLVQHIVDVLHRFVLGMYFSQRITYDAYVPSQLGDQRHYFIGIAQNFDALCVRVVAHAKRFLNVVGEFSAIHTGTGLKQYYAKWSFGGTKFWKSISSFKKKEKKKKTIRHGKTNNI